MRGGVRVSIVMLVGIALGTVLIGACAAGGAREREARAGSSSGATPVTGARVRVAWSESVRGWPSQLTADERGVVVVSGGRFVAALTREGGAREWEAEVPGVLNPFIEPAVDRDSVLVNAGDRFVMLERSDGAIRWETPIGPGSSEASGVALVPASQAGTIAVTASVDGQLVGRDVATGTPTWSVVHPGSLDTHLAADATTGLVAAIWQTTDAATVRVFEAASGRRRWEQVVEPMVASPAIGRDFVIAAAGDGDYGGQVHAFGLVDGRAAWVTPVPGSFEPDQIPGIASGRGGTEVGVQDHFGTVTLLDLATGAIRWQTDTAGPSLGGRLLITDDVVVVRTEGQQLVILGRSGGAVRARRTDPTGLPEGIATMGDRVLVGWRWAEPGRIDALEIEIPRAGT